jgi:hypothetical protein
MLSRSGKPRKRMEMRCGAAGATVFLMMLASAFGGTDQAEAGPFLFCANPGNTTVTQIDIGTRQITVVMDINDGLTGPSESTIDSDGNLYIANVSSPDILRLSKDGQVSVFVTGQGILNEIKGLAFDSQGDLFIASNGIYKFDVNSSTLTLLSHVTSANPLFNVIEDIEFDHDGNFYAASGRNIQGLGAIVKFDPQGNASVFATGLQNPRDLAVDNLGHLYVANMVGEVVNRLTCQADLSSYSRTYRRRLEIREVSKLTRTTMSTCLIRMVISENGTRLVLGGTSYCSPVQVSQKRWLFPLPLSCMHSKLPLILNPASPRTASTPTVRV